MPTTDSSPIFAPSKPLAAHYAGTTGSSGSTASRDRAEGEKASGVSAMRQARILELLKQAGTVGMTVAELRVPENGLGHHGSVSGACTNMHAEGLIVALKFDRRNGSGVYVLPEFVRDRPVRKFQSTAEKAAPTRPHLTASEKEVIGNIRGALARAGDRPIQLKPSTARALLAAVARLDA